MPRECRVQRCPQNPLAVLIDEHTLATVVDSDLGVPGNVGAAGIVQLKAVAHAGGDFRSSDATEAVMSDSQNCIRQRQLPKSVGSARFPGTTRVSMAGTRRLRSASLVTDTDAAHRPVVVLDQLEEWHGTAVQLN